MSGPVLALVVESSPQPSLKIWDVKRESCVTEDSSQDSANYSWAKAVVADFTTCGILFCTRKSLLELWDMRKLDGPVAASAPNVGGTSTGLRANFPSKLALSSSADGMTHLVDLNADSDSLNTLKSLPGHTDEVVWASVDWGNEQNQAIKAVTISMERDVLFWDVAWHNLQLPPEDVSEVEDHVDEPDEHPFWQPRRLASGHQYRSQVAAYDATATHAQISALTGSAEGLVHCWSLDIMDHDNLHKFGSPLVGHTDQVTALSADWRGRSALSGSCDSTLRLWDVGGRRCDGLLLGHKGSIRTLVADWIERRAISTSVDDAHIWDLGRHGGRERRPVASLAVHCGVCESLVTFSAGSAAFVNRTGIEFWDLEPLVRTYSLQCHPGTLFAIHLGGDEMDARAEEQPSAEPEDTEALPYLAGLMPAVAGSCSVGWCRTVL